MTAEAPDAERAFAHLRRSLADELAGEPARRVHLIGIHSGGAWIAERLHRELSIATPLGTLSSAFHRDDYGRRGIWEHGVTRAVDEFVASGEPQKIRMHNHQFLLRKR